jgi:hypothetical protein
MGVISKLSAGRSHGVGRGTGWTIIVSVCFGGAGMSFGVPGVSNAHARGTSISQRLLSKDRAGVVVQVVESLAVLS